MRWQFWEAVFALSQKQTGFTLMCKDWWGPVAKWGDQLKNLVPRKLRKEFKQTVMEQAVDDEQTNWA